jgi:hypothetical protein
VTNERRRKTNEGLHRADEVRVQGHTDRARKRRGSHHGDWHLYSTWAAETGHAHGADPYATEALDNAWCSTLLDRVDRGGSLQPAVAA